MHTEQKLLPKLTLVKKLSLLVGEKMSTRKFKTAKKHILNNDGCSSSAALKLLAFQPFVIEILLPRILHSFPFTQVLDYRQIDEVMPWKMANNKCECLTIDGLSEEDSVVVSGLISFCLCAFVFLFADIRQFNHAINPLCRLDRAKVQEGHSVLTP